MLLSQHRPSVEKRIRRIRSKIEGSALKPRLSVTRSGKHLHAQLIDDKAGKSILGASTTTLKAKLTKTEAAAELGKLIAELAIKNKIKQAVLDRGRFRYHGRIATFADAARKAGLKV